MARVGTGNESVRSPVGALPAMVFAAIALCIAMNASTHGGGRIAEGCHNDRKRGRYHCHRGDGGLTRNDAAPTNNFRLSQIAPMHASRGFARVFANCAEARAAGAAPVRRDESGDDLHLDRVGDWVGCDSAKVMLEKCSRDHEISLFD